MTSSETKTFRPRPLAWVGMIIVGIAWEVAAFSASLFFPRNGLYIGLILGLVFLGIYLRFVMRPLRLTYITISDNSLSGWVEATKEFQVSWDEIEAAHFYYKRGAPYSAQIPLLWLATSEQILEIPVSIFAYAPIWTLVQKHLRAEQCGKTAMRAWMEQKGLYSPLTHLIQQKWAAQQVKEAAPELLKANYAPFPVFKWFCFLSSILLSFILIQDTNASCVQFLFALGVLGIGWFLVLVVMKSVVEMTHNTITWLTFRGCFQIHWDEINYVTYSPLIGRTGILCQRAEISCRGNNKSFHAPGPDMWRGSDCLKMRALLEHQLHSHNIRPNYTWNTTRLSPNTRLPWRAYFDQIPTLSEERRALARSVWISALLSLSIAGLSTLSIVVWALVRIINR